MIALMKEGKEDYGEDDDLNVLENECEKGPLTNKEIIINEDEGLEDDDDSERESDQKEEMDDCAICLTALLPISVNRHRLLDSTTVASLPVCPHKFHLRCLQEWAGKSPLCPCCKKSFDRIECFFRSGRKRVLKVNTEVNDAYDYDDDIEEDEDDEEEENATCHVCSKPGYQDTSGAGRLFYCNGASILSNDCTACVHGICLGLENNEYEEWMCTDCLAECELASPTTVASSSHPRLPYPSHTSLHNNIPHPSSRKSDVLVESKRSTSLWTCNMRQSISFTEKFMNSVKSSNVNNQPCVRKARKRKHFASALAQEISEEIAKEKNSIDTTGENVGEVGRNAPRTACSKCLSQATPVNRTRKGHSSSDLYGNDRFCLSHRHESSNASSVKPSHSHKRFQHKTSSLDDYLSKLLGRRNK